MKLLFSVLTICLLSIQSWANLIYHPISFTIQTEKESYYEGEKINFIITVSNTSKEYSLMFLFIIGRENADLKSLLVECFSTILNNSNLGFLRII